MAPADSPDGASSVRTDATPGTEPQDAAPATAPQDSKAPQYRRVIVGLLIALVMTSIMVSTYVGQSTGSLRTTSPGE
jgi:hypothetical protein